ncbi:MAG TPA: hypothetical protein VNT79_01410 [Phycisphaerae bacterium]|nr:hypothetical protein [Phycisphaerae bacterium]
MIYLAACIWLLVAVSMAWGVYCIWGTMIKPRTLDILLFPGTAVAQVGRTVALLVTGAKFNPKAVPDKKDATASEGPVFEPSIPVFGPILTGFVPLAFTICAIFAVLTRLGEPVLIAIPHDQITQELPNTLSVFWNQLRGLITLAERTLDALRSADMVNWRFALFTYVFASLAIRLSPFRGNAAGLFGAILIAAGGIALIGTLTTLPADLIQQGWPIFCVTLGMLVLLLIGTLIARGVFATVRMLAHLQ